MVQLRMPAAADVTAGSRGGHAKQEEHFKVILRKPVSRSGVTGATFHAAEDHFDAAKADQCVASVWGFGSWIKSLKPLLRIWRFL